jgi:antitoxin component of MazEF toxin-antitoxin module
VVRKLTLRQVGGSIGATLPKDMTERLHLEVGDHVLAVETAEGILLTPFDPSVEEGLALAAKTAEVERPARVGQVMAAEPRWLPRVVLDAAHLDQVRGHGGLAGVRDENALEAALARAPQNWHYNPTVRFPELVAAYGFGVATAHPYNDGNKRVAFLAMAIFAD